jgi:photosystem II stability/assembly factor-like uncharacterized protein
MRPPTAQRGAGTRCPPTLSTAGVRSGRPSASRTGAILSLVGVLALAAPPGRGLAQQAVPAGSDARSGHGTPQGSPARLTSRLLSDLRLREVGPTVTGGRVDDVEALAGDPATVYVASATGGLWKSVNGGTTWAALFQHEAVSTIGDVAVAPSDPRVVWVGTGEPNNRQSTTWGDGVYRSTDGGRSWKHLGLEETRQIGRIRVDPRDADVAFVAAQGNLWRPNAERGVFRTRDGGATWKKVLYVDTLTGATDLVMDPTDPATLYAATYQRLRRTWGFNGGGPGSGIWKTTDGGDHWTELGGGLPPGPRGRIALAVAASDPRILYALVQHADSGGVYRTDDGGRSWRRVNALDPRPSYYSQIRVDPKDPDRVYVLGVEFYGSSDGGRTFVRMPTRPTYDVGVHSDYHALWIDPANPRHFYLAGDAGLVETEDRGATYRRIDNIPIGQFYAIGADDRVPYRIYGGMQDVHSWMAPSASRNFMGIRAGQWKEIGFGDGTYMQPSHPAGEPLAVFVGSNDGDIRRLDPETGDLLDVNPRAPEGETYRFDWDAPILVSAHDPHVVYLGGNRLFVSRDRGSSWSATPDLTKAIDRDTLSLMGLAGSEATLSRNDGTGSFSEITTIAESPLTADVLWVGTDDGNIQVSRDGGGSWTEVGHNVSGVPPTMYVSRVTASRAGAGVAYAAFDGHRRGDFTPHLFRTTNFGRSWAPVDAGLPAGAGTVNDVVEDPRNPELLFLGTEHGLWASGDRGETWARMEGATKRHAGGRLPTTIFEDLLVKEPEGDLVVATHGRGIWILDDLSAVESWSGSAAAAPAVLLPTRGGTITEYWKQSSYRAQAAWFGENPPWGAVLAYHLSNPDTSARIEITNGAGQLVRTLGVPGEAGVLHRVVWDLRHPSPPAAGGGGGQGGESGNVVPPDTVLPALPHELGARGPFVSPGEYTATLIAGGTRSSQAVRVKADPALALNAEQWREREAWLVDLLALQRRVSEASSRARDLADSLGKQGAASADSARALAAGLGRLRRELSRLAGHYNRSNVQPPSLSVPTGTDRKAKETLRGSLREAEAALTGLAGG